MCENTRVCQAELSMSLDLFLEKPFQKVVKTTTNKAKQNQQQHCTSHFLQLIINTASGTACFIQCLTQAGLELIMWLEVTLNLTPLLESLMCCGLNPELPACGQY